MKPAPLLFFTVITLIFSLSITGYAFSTEGQYIHFKQMSVEFDGTDAEVTVYYDLNMFSRLYVLLLGSYNLESTLENVFFDFEDVSVMEIGNNRAVLYVEDISRQNSEYYLHDSHDLGATVDVLTMIYPDGSSRSVPYAISTPYTFYGND
ncbi:hypothetical protein [Methanolobus halotolerans]|uniref:Uncharacterized protein n=1 Tax=Methanolobus halotolerans TaxID=2052935 RepID=A0A4E0R2A3_9EURY|nr:hypothetical protein [Methanolobus halotolerans]TGC11513.1 hypothetical protein CUN85_01180 [Methanolobus halotolerans]